MAPEELELLALLLLPLLLPLLPEPLVLEAGVEVLWDEVEPDEDAVEEADPEPAVEEVPDVAVAPDPVPVVLVPVLAPAVGVVVTHALSKEE